MAEDMLLRLLPWASILAAADTPDSITRAGGTASLPILPWHRVICSILITDPHGPAVRVRCYGLQIMD